MIPGNSLEWLFVGINGSGRKLFRVRLGENICVGVSYVHNPLNSNCLGPEVARFVGYQISENFILNVY